VRSATWRGWSGTVARVPGARQTHDRRTNADRWAREPDSDLRGAAAVPGSRYRVVPRIGTQHARGARISPLADPTRVPLGRPDARHAVYTGLREALGSRIYAKQRGRQEGLTEKMDTYLTA
jgi:hypothetical protein